MGRQDRFRNRIEKRSMHLIIFQHLGDSGVDVLRRDVAAKQSHNERRTTLQEALVDLEDLDE